MNNPVGVLTLKIMHNFKRRIMRVTVNIQEFYFLRWVILTQQIIKELGRDGSLTKQQQTALTAVLDQAMALARARVQR
jgi:hypothetical protein